MNSTIRITKVCGNHFHLSAKDNETTMNKLLRKKLRIVIEKYKHTDKITNDYCTCIFINTTQDEANRVRQICHNLGVSVSDFLKITLYNELQ